MDSGVLKPIAPTAAMPAVRPQEKNSSPTKTELPAEKAVRPADKTSQTRPMSENAQRPDEGDKTEKLEQKHYRDAITQDVVYRTINPDNGEVVRQIPDESLLRLRRYFAAYDQLSRQASVDTKA